MGESSGWCWCSRYLSKQKSDDGYVWCWGAKSRLTFSKADIIHFIFSVFFLNSSFDINTHNRWTRTLMIRFTVREMMLGCKRNLILLIHEFLLTLPWFNHAKKLFNKLVRLWSMLAFIKSQAIFHQSYSFHRTSEHLQNCVADVESKARWL